jgi:hypothetical protein
VHSFSLKFHKVEGGKLHAVDGFLHPRKRFTICSR